MRKFFSFFLFFLFIYAQAQELNCSVKVNYDQISGTNTQVYRTLEKSLNDFVNNTAWTSGRVYKSSEKINCSMVIIVANQANDQFSASIQVQSTRPVYNSSYSTPVFNYNDKDFSFSYQEYQQLNFNPDSFDSNLMSVVAFYCYMIIAMDADTYAPKGGTSTYEIAQNVASYAQASGNKGWTLSDGPSNRYFLINDVLSNTFSPYRESMYQYHMQGLDVMYGDALSGKTNIKQAAMNLQKIHSVRPNSLMVRVFFDAKSDEVVSVFSGGPSIPTADLVDALNKISPPNATKWAQIKY